MGMIRFPFAAGVAVEILSGFEKHELDIVTKKVAALCLYDLRHARATGLCNMRLWCLLAAFRDHSAADQQVSPCRLMQQQF
jgi:hypothetical protein